MQEAGESYDHYKTSLRKLAEGCDFNMITLDEILRDSLIFGINDGKVRESLLQEAGLTLAKTDEICRAAESMRTQMKMVGDIGGSEMNKMRGSDPEQKRKKTNGLHVAEYNINAKVQNARIVDSDIRKIGNHVQPKERTATPAEKGIISPPSVVKK